MDILVGEVTDSSNSNGKHDGQFYAKFIIGGTEIEKPVTYTSPYYRVNMGGFVGIPEPQTQILAFHNKKPKREGESEFYYHSTIVKDKSTPGQELDNPTFQALRDNDNKSTIYSDPTPSEDGDSIPGKPVTQAFTNPVGAGLYITRNYAKDKILNDVTVKAQNDCEVNVGALGIQLKNEEGDNILLNSTTLNDGYAARSLSIVTRGNHEYKCTNADITMKIQDGGDINIENNSTGMFGTFKLPDGRIEAPAGTTPQSGNVRLKTRWRDIILAALGLSSKIHIVTNNAKVVLDSETGNIDIFSQTGSLGTPGNINIQSAGLINMESARGISMKSLGPIQIDSGTTITNTATAEISNNAVTNNLNGLPINTINPPQGIGGQQVPFISFPPPEIIPVPPQADDYNDGLPGAGAT